MSKLFNLHYFARTVLYLVPSVAFYCILNNTRNYGIEITLALLLIYGLFLIFNPKLAIYSLVFFVVFDIMPIIRTGIGLIRYYQLFNLAIVGCILLKWFYFFKSRLFQKITADFYLLLFLWFLVNLLLLLKMPNQYDGVRQVIIYFSLVSITIFSIEISKLYDDIFPRVIQLFFLSGIIVCLYGFYQALSYLFFGEVRMIDGSIARIYVRPWGTFTEANWYGIYLLLIISMYLPFKLRVKFQFKKLANLLLFYFPLIGIAISGNRGIILGLIILSFIVSIQSKRIKYFISIAGILIISSVGLLYIDKVKGTSLIYETMYRFKVEPLPFVSVHQGLSNLSRLNELKMIIDSSFRNYFLGAGPGSFAKYFFEWTGASFLIGYDGIPRTSGGTAFSPYVNIFFESGILGLIIFLFLFFYIWRKNFYFSKKFSNDPICQGFFWSINCIIFMALMYPLQSIGFFWMFIGLNIQYIIWKNKQEKMNIGC